MQRTSLLVQRTSLLVQPRVFSGTMIRYSEARNWWSPLRASAHMPTLRCVPAVCGRGGGEAEQAEAKGGGPTRPRRRGAGRLRRAHPHGGVLRGLRSLRCAISSHFVLQIPNLTLKPSPVPRHVCNWHSVCVGLCTASTAPAAADGLLLVTSEGRVELFELLH